MRNQFLKIKTILVILLVITSMTQTLYANTYTANTFDDFQKFLQQDLSSYQNKITIHYRGNEKFREEEIKDKLHELFNASNQNLSAFDKQNIYSIGILGSATSSGRNYVLRTAEYEMQYKNTTEELEEIDAILENVLEKIALTCSDDYETTKAIYEYVLTSFYYEKLALDDSDSESILLERNLLNGLKGNNGVVCDAYVMLLCRMLTAFKIENVIVTGTTYGELHVWNKVKLNDIWYNIDPTWGDSKYIENKERYFLTSDAFLMLNGRVWTESDYPSSPTTYYSFQ